jgi:hypothetical protein
VVGFSQVVARAAAKAPADGDVGSDTRVVGDLAPCLPCDMAVSDPVVLPNVDTYYGKQINTQVHRC